MIDYPTTRFEEAAGKVDVVLDTIGGDTQQRSWQVLKKGEFSWPPWAIATPQAAREHGVRGEGGHGSPRYPPARPNRGPDQCRGHKTRSHQILAAGGCGSGPRTEPGRACAGANTPFVQQLRSAGIDPAFQLPDRGVQFQPAYRSLASTDENSGMNFTEMEGFQIADGVYGHGSSLM